MRAIASYQISWLRRDVVAGIVLTTLLVPQRGGLTTFFFQYLLQMGVFFLIPLYLSVALGLSAIATEVRIMPLSITLLAAALGIPCPTNRAQKSAACRTPSPTSVRHWARH